MGWHKRRYVTSVDPNCLTRVLVSSVAVRYWLSNEFQGLEGVAARAEPFSLVMPTDHGVMIRPTNTPRFIEEFRDIGSWGDSLAPFIQLTEPR
jgi:hypothetical protein